MIFQTKQRKKSKRKKRGRKMMNRKEKQVQRKIEG